MGQRMPSAASRLKNRPPPVPKHGALAHSRQCVRTVAWLAAREGFMMAHQHISRGLARTGVVAWIGFALTGILACTGQGVTPAPATVIATPAYPAAHARETVRSGSSGVLDEAGQQLAQSQGYFAQEGVAIDFVKVDASTVFATLIAGQVDVQGLGL